jgi:hypothetical protein
MATVYRAYQPALDRYVAVKVLPAYYVHEPGFAERFTREARAVAKLTHPHVLPIYDFGQVDGLSYIVMQYVEAGTLKEMLGQPISLIVAADFIEQIADALDYAHEQGIIHRDVKPSNVLMDRSRWVLLSDFGLAKMVEGSVQLTGSGVGVGTPAYMAPEQGQGLGVDQRADVYSLGIVLYEMVTGRVPFEAETPMAIVVKHITEPLPLPRTVNPDLPESVERIILKALAKNPEDRYESAGKMAAAFRKEVAGLDTEVVGASLSPLGSVVATGDEHTILEDAGATQALAPPVAPPMRRKTFPIWLLALAGILLFICMVGLFGLVSRAPNARQTAVVQVGGGMAPSGPDAVTPEHPLPSGDPSPGDVESFMERALAFIEHNPPVFEDDFRHPNPRWHLVSNERGQFASHEGDALVVHVPEVQGQESVASILVPLDESPADFVLQMDLVALEGGPGAVWSISFRAQPETFLFAGLKVDPSAFGIGHDDSGTETMLAAGPAENYRSDEMMQITLVAIGPRIALFLEDELLGVTHTELKRPGKVVLNAINDGDPMVAYGVDNVRMWDLKSLRKPSGANQTD